MQLLTGRDLRQTLKISRTTLFRLLKQGLPSVGAGRLRRFDYDQVLRWLKERAGKASSSDVTMHRPGIYRCIFCCQIACYSLVTFDCAQGPCVEFNELSDMTPGHTFLQE